MDSYLKANLKILLVLFLTMSGTICSSQSSHKQLIDSAVVASEKMHYQRSLIFLKDALKISEKSKKKQQIIGDLLEIGRNYMSLDDMDQALEYYLDAQRLSDQIKNDSITFEVANSLTNYYIQIESLEIAKKHLDHSKKLADKLGDLELQQRYYNALGIYQRRKGDFIASIEAYKKCLEFIPSTKLDEQFTTYLNISTAYAYNNDLETAYAYLMKAEKLNETINSDWNRLGLYGQIGRIELLRGNPQKAIEYYELGLENATKVENYDMIQRFSRELARAYRDLGNFKEAYHYYAGFVFELEKSHERENATAIAEMSAKYENEKKEQKIQSLEEQQKLKAQIHKSEMDRRNLWILVALLLVCSTIIVAFFVLKNQRNKQRLKLELVQQQKEIAQKEAELRGQELERNRLSRELHDGLGGTLASIKMRLSAKNIETINPILEDIDAACQDVRNMSHSLSATFVNEIDFYSLLLKLSKDIEQRSSLQVQLEFMPIDELNQLESETRHQCYRIIQELTNNAIKHAQATTLTIGVMKNENDVILLVEDNGIGFELASSPSGIGIDNVRKRLETINGNLDITSSPNSGSTFAISFPYIRKHEN